MGARFGQEIFEAMRWAKRQKKPIGEFVPTVGDARFIAYSDVHSDDADQIDQSPVSERKLGNFLWRCQQSCSKKW